MLLDQFFISRISRCPTIVTLKLASIFIETLSSTRHRIDTILVWVVERVGQPVEPGWRLELANQPPIPENRKICVRYYKTGLQTRPKIICDILNSTTLLSILETLQQMLILRVGLWRSENENFFVSVCTPHFLYYLDLKLVLFGLGFRRVNEHKNESAFAIEQHSSSDINR